jgi:hypothetical protein
VLSTFSIIQWGQSNGCDLMNCPRYFDRCASRSSSRLAAWFLDSSASPRTCSVPPRRRTHLYIFFERRLDKPSGFHNVKVESPSTIFPSSQQTARREWGPAKSCLFLALQKLDEKRAQLGQASVIQRFSDKDAMAKDSVGEQLSGDCVLWLTYMVESDV